MPRDKTANHIRLMAAARQEFLEYGFEKASMRSIGERCGLTAAGIYRHCRDKEDLFEQLVMHSVLRIDEWLAAHVARYVDTVQKGHTVTWRDSEIDMMREIVYPNMEDYQLLLDSMMFRLIQISENARKLSDEFRLSEHPGIPWIAMFGLRNSIVHDYGSVDLSIIYDTLKNSIPELYNQLYEEMN